MAKLEDDQRRALEMLAHQDGCAEAALLADGFSIDQRFPAVDYSKFIFQNCPSVILARDPDSAYFNHISCLRDARYDIPALFGRRAARPTAACRRPHQSRQKSLNRFGAISV
jgi:hypothetical protein